MAQIVNFEPSLWNWLNKGDKKSWFLPSASAESLRMSVGLINTGSMRLITVLICIAISLFMQGKN